MLVAEWSDTETRIQVQELHSWVTDGKTKNWIFELARQLQLMRTLHYSDAVRRELSKKSTALIFRNSLCPLSPAVFLYDNENSVMTKRVRSQASKMRFLQKIKGVTLLARCTSLEIRNSLKLLLLQIERSQLRWFGRVSRMPQERLPNKLYLPKQVWKIVQRNIITVAWLLITWKYVLCTVKKL